MSSRPTPTPTAARAARSGGRITADSFTGYRELRASMLARGDAKPIWFTEFGWNTSTVKCNPGSGQWQGGVSEERQALYLRRAFKLVERDRYVKVAIWYNLRDNWWQRGADEPEARFGLLRADYSRKPAFYAFKAYARPKLRPRATTVTVALAPRPAAGRGVRIEGAVRGADAGRVRIAVKRWAGKGWRLWQRRSARLDSEGRYRVPLKPLGPGRYRARARYLGTDLHRPSASRWRSWRVAPTRPASAGDGALGARARPGS